MLLRVLTQAMRRAALVAGPVLAAAVLSLTMGPGPAIAAQATDSLFPRAAADPRVLVVLIDDAFSRQADLDPLALYTPLVTTIEAGAAATVALETDFLDIVLTQFGQSAASDFGLRNVAAALRLLGNGVLPAGGRRFLVERPGEALPSLSAEVPGSILADAAAGTGVDTVFTTPTNSVLRRLPLLVDAGPGGDDATVLPSLALLAWMHAEHLEPGAELDGGRLTIDGRSIPIEGRAELRVNYASALLPGGAQVVTASELIDRSAPIPDLSGKVLVLGTPSATPAASVAAPTARRLAPVYVQANAINTLLTGQFMTPARPAATAIAVGLLALLTALLVLVLPLWLAPLAPVGIGGGYWALAAAAFERGRIADLIHPLAGVVAAFVAALGWRAVHEVNERRRVGRMFARYVPESVARDLLHAHRAERAALGQRLDVAVLFCDLRGFTALSATLEPAQVRALLDTYYEVMTGVVLDAGGTVLRFIGDEVFAVFGAPLPVTGHVGAALDAALAMLAANPALDAELAAQGLPAISYGIGLHAGTVVAADVGSSAHRQYDVLGDAVNIASRLCSQAKAGEVVFSDAVYAQASGAEESELLGLLELKGVTEPITGHRQRAIPAPDPV